MSIFPNFAETVDQPPGKPQFQGRKDADQKIDDKHSDEKDGSVPQTVANQSLHISPSAVHGSPIPPILLCR
jgi:hypothetical protein